MYLSFQRMLIRYTLWITSFIDTILMSSEPILGRINNFFTSWFKSVLKSSQAHSSLCRLSWCLRCQTVNRS